ncbi:MAG TPA: prepilin-type N-terminal cleavage/methylation domain-containing protein [Chthoniobacterales bacterium]
MYFSRKPVLPIRNPHSAFRIRAGFTLVEVVLGVLILSLLAGVLFTLVQSTLEAAAELNVHQGQTQEFNGLVEVCRKTFQTLDGKAEFTAKVVRAKGGGYVQQLSIVNAPLALAWQGDGTEAGITLMAPRPQANGLLAFCIQHQSGDVQTNQLDEPTKWFVLVRDLKKLEWRFYDSRANQWRKEWQDTTFRPTLVELIINSNATRDDERIVFPMVPAAQG